jgi:hypothetical protein
MDFKFLASLSWREMLLAAIVLLAIYILFTFLRINRLKRETQAAQELSPGAFQDTAEQEVESTRDDAVVQISVAAEEHSRVLELRRKVDVLEQELAQLRREIGGLRVEVQTLREEQRREISKVKITQSASPFYSDAMHLATQGREAADISVLCGISRAEAELVVALTRNDGQALD